MAFARPHADKHVEKQRQADRPVEQYLPHDGVFDQANTKPTVDHNTPAANTKSTPYLWASAVEGAVVIDVMSGRLRMSRRQD